MQYTLYLDKRPLRVAFFVDPNSITEGQINNLFDYNIKKWGGRYNPVIFTDGKSISDNDWLFLKSYDADVIKSFIPLGTDILEELYHNLTPYLVDDKTPNDQYIHIEDTGAWVGVNALSTLRSNMAEEPKLIVFKYDHQNIEKHLKNFIDVNFGHSNLPEGSRISYINIKNKDDFNKVFKTLVNKSHIVYPIQLCAIPNYPREAEYNYKNEIFTIIIGDKTEDIFYGWNRGITLGSYRRDKFNQVWLSTEMLKDEVVFEDLKKWLHHTIELNTKHNGGTRIVSTSLNKEELDGYKELLLKGSYLHCDTEVVKTENAILKNFNFDLYLDRNKRDLDVFEIEDQIDKEIKISTERLLYETTGSGHFVFDMYAKYYTRSETYYGKEERLLQFPRRNVLMQKITNKPARINALGVPSIITDIGEPYVRVQLPQKGSFLRRIISESYTPRYTSDSRKDIVKGTKYHLKYSNAGKNLIGFNQLVNGLEDGYNILLTRA